MSILLQGRRFVTVGAAQTTLSWGSFVAMTALGMPVVPANILGRIIGANFGFWFNGRYTFGKRKLDWSHAARFVSVWTFLTIISTVLVSIVAAHLGLHAAWLAKPLVEACVACVAFFLWKYVVYQ